MSVDHLQRADDLIELKKFGLAASEARRALAQNPEDAEAHYLLAWALWKSGKTKNALMSAKKAVHCEPEYANAHSLLARLFDETRKRKKARVHHQKAIQFSPNVSDFYVTYALHLYWDFPVDIPFIVPYTPIWNTWKKAMDLLEKALTLNPRHDGAYRVRAMWLGKIQRFSEAHQDLSMALNIVPNHPRTYEILGDLHSAEIHLSEASSAYREALRLDPDNKQIKTKFIHTVGARIPWIGILLYISRGKPAGWRGVLVAFLIFIPCTLFFLLEWIILSLVYIYSLLALILLLRLIGDFLVTQAILKGWIKI